MKQAKIVRKDKMARESKIVKDDKILKDVKVIREVSFYYALVSALFLGLAPQFLGYMFPILFILPIYLGLTGIKSRKKVGYYIAMGLVPLSTSVAVLWIRYVYSIKENFQGEFLSIASKFSIDISMIKTITFIGTVFSFILLILAIILFVKLIKNRQVFVNYK